MSSHPESDVKKLNDSSGCEWCGTADNLRRCARCRLALYCCKEHQRQHWIVHKTRCVKPNVEVNSKLHNNGITRTDNGRTRDDVNGFRLPVSATNGDNSMTMESLRLEDPDPEACSNSILSPFRHDVSVCGNANLKRNSDVVRPASDPARPPPEWLRQLSIHVVSDMNRYGICVLDNFLGPIRGQAIEAEVKNLYAEGLFQEGQLVSNRMQESQTVRGDRIVWVDGSEMGCGNVGFLIHTLDLLVTACNKMKNNGVLSKYQLNRRTKAMIACYPGNGTHYVKHVDNPNQDGRCITCIYYLNKNWNTKDHGGLLRMFPVGYDSQVADIEPLFDRVLFFWSDRRNPHEVQPAFAVRFAITVWYFDADERNQALVRFRTQQDSPQKNADHFSNLQALYS